MLNWHRPTTLFLFAFSEQFSVFYFACMPILVNDN